MFAWLDTSGLLTSDERRRRFVLAIEAREFNLAAWLARRIGEPEQESAAAWKAMRDNPRRELSRHERVTDTAENRDRLAYGFSRLARQDPAYADLLWQNVQRQFDFDPVTVAAVGESIALVAAWRHQPEATRLIARVDPERRSTELLDWQARAGLRESEWSEVLAAVALMDPESAGAENWVYWKARALAASDANDAATELLATLATERSYYGFLAADILGQPYALMHEPLHADSDRQRSLEAETAVIRARELFLTGLAGRARSEWDRFVAGLPSDDQLQAALLAHRLGWHSRAIATVARGGHYDDLTVRYPLPWIDSFESSSEAVRIEPAWALGIARSESLFMHDVRSRAGAIGLMQLMPATGRATAKAAKLPYRGSTTLTDPAANIALGTRYLSDMYYRFGEHRALATAAYNAGPHRVDRWLPDSDALPATVWIETIPYDETRKYVQRVLAADTVFHWRMTDSTRRVSELLKPVQGPSRQAALGASASGSGH